VGDREGGDRDRAEQGVPADGGERGADAVAVGVQRQAEDGGGEEEADAQRRDPRADHDDAVPVAPPALGVDLAAVLEGDAAADEGEQHEQERQVGGRKQPGVPGGEGGEHGPAGDDQPDLVAVPDGPDGVDHDAALGVVLGEDGQQHADAEVEAFEEEVPEPEEGDDGEPDDGEGHRAPTTAVRHDRLSAAWWR
jgi:hypothetical protein